MIQAKSIATQITIITAQIQAAESAGRTRVAQTLRTRLAALEAQRWTGVGTN